MTRERPTTGPAHVRARRRVAALVAVLAATALVGVAAPPAQAADRYGYEITGTGRLKVDVMWASTAPFQGAFLWPDNASLSQEFDLLDSGGGYFRIRARHSGQCLMLDWRNFRTNGTPIIQYPYCDAGYAPAEWTVRVLSGTTCDGDICTTGFDHYLLVNRWTGQCLDADNGAGGRPPAQARLQDWQCVTSVDAWNVLNQSWFVAPAGSVRID